MSTPVSAARALEKLRDGNQRFITGAAMAGTAGQVYGRVPADAQSPMAIILGCSDSRVPAELIFDQGFGDLFVIRVAGNIVAPTQIASVEFAASRFGTRLVVVLGHTQCGAIQATLDELWAEAPVTKGAIRSIVDRVKPALQDLVPRGGFNDPGAIMTEAVRANIRASVKQLRDGSEEIRRLLDNNGLAIVGAEYSLETGVVEFFD